MSERLTDVERAAMERTVHEAMARRGRTSADIRHIAEDCWLAARESVSLPNERQLRVLAERAYPGLAPSGFCSGHAVEHPYDCTVCYPDLPALIQEHIRVREARVAELERERDEARQKRVNHLDDCIVAEARVATLEAALRELVRLKELKTEPRTKQEALEYEIAKEDAWQVARAALNASPSRSPSDEDKERA